MLIAALTLLAAPARPAVDCPFTPPSVREACGCNPVERRLARRARNLGLSDDQLPRVLRCFGLDEPGGKRVNVGSPACLLQAGASRKQAKALTRAARRAPQMVKAERMDRFAACARDPEAARARRKSDKADEKAVEELMKEKERREEPMHGDD